MDYVTLKNGVQMPKEGFGVFQIRDLDECERVVLDAIDTGYRLIDTAESYGNESAVGKAIAKSGVNRADLFISTKLWVTNTSYEGAKAAIDRSMENLGVDYLDLYLIHQAMGDYIGAWRAMTEAYKEGRIRGIGLCKLYGHRLPHFSRAGDELRAVSQVELHPFFQQENTLSLMREYGVQPMAWAPFAEGRHGIFTHPVLTKIGEKYGKGAGQVALRWNMQRGVVVIPKSTHRERMEQNIDVFDFSLTDEEMREIAALDIGHSEIIDHTDPKLVQALHGRKL